MTTVINSTTYQDGKRITEQTVTYLKSDDIQALGRLQMNLAATLQQLEKMNGTEPQYERLVSSKAVYEQAIAAQQAIVDGYTEE